MSRRVVFATLVACLALVQLAAAQAPKPDPQAVEDARAKGYVAGTRAGETAGVAAGKDAGQAAAQKTLREMAPKPTAPSVKPAPPKPKPYDMTPEERARVQEKDPGAASFFREFDADDNWRWSQTEYIKAIRAAIERRYLPADFKVTYVWSTLPKNEQGEIGLKEFLNFASSTSAQPPPAVAKAAPKTSAFDQFSAKNCKQIFDAFDEDKNGALDLNEFKLATQGKLDDAKAPDVFYSLPLRGAAGKGLTFDAFSAVCASLWRLPRTSSAEEAKKDPCADNPCKNRRGTVCVPDYKQCVKAPCPQFKCVRLASPAANSVLDTNTYGQCVRVFRDFDTNQDRALGFSEFETGLKRAQAAGTLSRDVRALDAWNRFDKTPRGQVDIYEFIHFCVAVTADADDLGASAREECWDVFTHFDEDRSQELSGREFFKGMRRARRQGHLPADLNINAVWNAMPKTRWGTVEVGPFIDFCLSVSKGDDPVVAAHESVPVPGHLPGATGRPQYPDGSISSVGTAAANVQFCAHAFKKSDLNSDGAISLDEFRTSCSLIANETECRNSSGLLTRYDRNKDGQLQWKHEYLRLCQASSVARNAGEAEKIARITAAEAAGRKAGQIAGAKLGALAGAQEGKKVALTAPSFVEVESVPMADVEIRPRTRARESRSQEGELRA